MTRQIAFSIFIILSAMITFGCRKPSRTEHQEFLTLATSIENNDQIRSKTNDLGITMNGVYGASVPPDIFIEIFYNKTFPEDVQREITKLIELERDGLKLNKRIRISYLLGDNLDNKKFGSSVIGE